MDLELSSRTQSRTARRVESQSQKSQPCNRVSPQAEKIPFGELSKLMSSSYEEFSAFWDTATEGVQVTEWGNTRGY
jgi:hypothetical protein